MRSRNRQTHHKPPEVNLVPMLDVLMTVLTFFIILSMVLGSQNSLEVNLPASGEDAPAEPDQGPPPPPLLIKLDRQGQTVVLDRAIPKDQLKADIQNYLKNPKGVVLIQPDRNLPYEKVLQLVSELRAAGPDRVTLAIGEEWATPAENAPESEAASNAEAAAPAEDATNDAINDATNNEAAEAETAPAASTPGRVLSDVPDVTND